jgi:NACalpha-BTF3-like transcription factor
MNYINKAGNLSKNEQDKRKMEEKMKQEMFFEEEDIKLVELRDSEGICNKEAEIMKDWKN